MKVQTIEQFHILQEIKKHFDMDAVAISITSRSVIAVVDKEGDAITFCYVDGRVIWE